MSITKRVVALEGRAGSGFETAHRVVCRQGQTPDHALDLYGRERIGPNDLVIMRVMVPAPLHGVG